MAKVRETNFMTDLTKIEAIADSCRSALEGLAKSKGSMFYDFPLGACGPAAEIVGRILKEQLGLDGTYVCGTGHPELKSNQTHAWYEVSNCTVDITYDQFCNVDLKGWVFRSKSTWHAKFQELDPRDGFCGPEGWPCYPFDGYEAAKTAVTLKIGPKAERDDG